MWPFGLGHPKGGIYLNIFSSLHSSFPQTVQDIKSKLCSTLSHHLCMCIHCQSNHCTLNITKPLQYMLHSKYYTKVTHHISHMIPVKKLKFGALYYCPHITHITSILISFWKYEGHWSTILSSKYTSHITLYTYHITWCHIILSPYITVYITNVIYHITWFTSHVTRDTFSETTWSGEWWVVSGEKWEVWQLCYTGVTAIHRGVTGLTTKIRFAFYFFSLN